MRHAEAVNERTSDGIILTWGAGPKECFRIFRIDGTWALRWHCMDRRSSSRRTAGILVEYSRVAFARKRS
jgi:hypothetical protein